MSIVRRSAEEYLEEINRSQRGRLKLYVGAAPGVGKTYKMLADAHTERKEGTDIVAGFIETHGRKETEEVIGDIECLPLKKIEYKGKVLKEVDILEIIKRKPFIVIIDELAHTNAPGSKNKKRFMDVEELLENGINVWAAFNIQHIESVHDIVQNITGVKVRERIPDYVIQEADEVQLVDTTPETLQKRLQDGKIYSEAKINQSLQNFFTLNNLGALRELVLREVADDLDSKHVTTAKIKEKILVCVQFSTTASKLVRRGWRIASRLNADMYVLNIQRKKESEISESVKQAIKEWQKLTEQFDAKFILRIEEKTSPADIIISVANELQITQILLGQSARTRLEEIVKGSIVNTIMRKTQNIDIHIVSDDGR